VVVPCHAVWSLTGNPAMDISWFLNKFQRGEPKLYLEHIRRAVEFVKSESRALLVFSGGQTNAAAGPISEAQGYWLIAERLGLWERDVKHRSTTDEYAVDSFENLLFSICRFYECVRVYPTRVKLFGWRFKESRFDFHRLAIRFPSNAFEYIGVNDPFPADFGRTG